MSFITDNFLLQNKFAEELYHNYACKMPIIDYHNHLIPSEIAQNRKYDNISQVWIAGDHYKWRAMRTWGISEELITGKGSDEEKFLAWAKTVPHTLRNPLFHWTHLELKRYFGIDEYLNENSASEIYQKVNNQLQKDSHTSQGLLQMMNVETLCTTEDPTDDLQHHKTLKNSDFGVMVSTAFRPDKAVLIDNENYTDYLKKLSDSAAVEIVDFKTLKDALIQRLNYFHENGCRLCDHGFNYISFQDFKDSEIEEIFGKKLNNKALSLEEVEKFKTAITLFLCEQYHSLGWVQQFHLGALRNNNQRMLAQLGPDTGWDSIGDFKQAETMAKFFNKLDSEDKLAKTIIYNLNPADNEIFATMVGNYNDGSTKGKMQFGSGWWFLDQKDGIIKQINALSNMGMLSCFVGMLTDSRSFLSFPRHEYFRRVLCNLLGSEMENGELPQDLDWVGQLVQDISYNNAKEYFNF